MTPPGALRWGLLGVSRILRSALLPAISAAPGHRAVACAARDPSRARAFADEMGLQAAPDYAGLIERSDIDAVYISIVNDAHLPWILRALAAGRHVLCEKPLTLDAAEARRAHAAADASGCVLMEAFCPGFHPQMEAAMAALRSGEIGEVVSIEAQFAHPVRDPDDYRWQARHGGGALLDLGTYCVNLIRAAAGREPARVAGSCTLRGDVDASFRGMLDFGAFGAVFACSLDGARAQSARIVGTGGVIEIDWPFSSKNRQTRTALSGAATMWAPFDPYRAMVEHFGAAVGGVRPVRHGAQDAVLQAAVLDALLASARGGVMAAP